LWLNSCFLFVLLGTAEAFLGFFLCGFFRFFRFGDIGSPIWCSEGGELAFPNPVILFAHFTSHVFAMDVCPYGGNLFQDCISVKIHRILLVCIIIENEMDFSINHLWVQTINIFQPEEGM